MKKDISKAFDEAGFQKATGEVMRSVRKSRAKTQEQVSEAIGIPRSTYANMELGRQRIPLDVVWRLGIVLQTDIKHLVPECAPPTLRSYSILNFLSTGNGIVPPFMPLNSI